MLLVRFLLIVIFLAGTVTTKGQQEGRARTRAVDYAEYDRLLGSFSYAKDKAKAATQFLAFVGKNFTAVDEEYFYVRYLLATQLTDNLTKVELLQQAIDAYEKNYPFFNRGYSTVNPALIGQVYISLSRIFMAQHLYSKNLAFLERNRALLEKSSDPYVRRDFYMLMGEVLLQAERYEESIEVFFKLKQLTDAGDLDQKYPSGAETFKIDADWPEETKRQIEKARVRYDSTMKAMGEFLQLQQRFFYNDVLARAYFKMYNYESCLPYAQQTADERELLNAYYRQSFEESKKLLNNTWIADSIKLQTLQSIEGYELMQQVAGQNLVPVISAMKLKRSSQAQQLAKDFMERAMYHQLNNNYELAEAEYNKFFKVLEQMKANRWYAASSDNLKAAYAPHYLNLKVKANQVTSALGQAQAIVAAEEQKLVRNFQYFTENEKREFFKNYTNELERYYSLLLLLTEKGNDQVETLLNKILQTKGLILDATREQERQLRKIKDNVTLAQIAQIKRLRDKLSAFYQQPPGNPATVDSINRISVRIGDLERAVNLKLVAVNILKPIRWQDVQARLKQGEVYLEILRLQRDNFEYDKPKVQYWGIVIKPGERKPALFQISEGEAFESRSLRNYQNRVRTQSEDNDSYNLYWKKISDYLQGATSAIVSADGVYHIVNPVSLQNPATQKYVIDEIEVKRISAGRDLLVSASADVAAKTIVLVGNPRFEMSRKQAGNVYRGNETVAVEASEGMRAGIAELPGTKIEVELIGAKAISGGFQLKMLTGPDANESNVKGLKSPGVLHLATHGQFDQLSKGDTYLKSKLVLAGAADAEPLSVSDYARYEDGWLTAYEVTQLDLPNTRLVVLSACETGLGEIQSGEGVWGLQRAFQLAGARAVMGSLWKISDEATVTFMEAFYEKYLKTKNISQAYQHAMLTTRQQYPQPYYWGAFTLVGAN
ncbi:MAG: CHAT domain-containing protein [Cyclobacteriaceae bacterium]|nr:CHAT domain-containing protein [Cyclobacteriaceae bacterium]